MMHLWYQTSWGHLTGRHLCSNGKQCQSCAKVAPGVACINIKQIRSKLKEIIWISHKTQEPKRRRHVQVRNANSGRYPCCQYIVPHMAR